MEEQFRLKEIVEWVIGCTTWELTDDSKEKGVRTGFRRKPEGRGNDVLIVLMQCGFHAFNKMHMPVYRANS